MRTCVCGFNGPADVLPWSPTWHKLHRDAHLARFPNVDVGTRRALDQLVAFAESANIESEPAEARIYQGDATWHDGPGWYWVDDEYRDEGSCGAFATREEAEAHAIESGYRIANALARVA